MKKPTCPPPIFPVGVAVAVLLAGLAHLLFYLVWYRQTPMGRFPVMDGYYNLFLARQMAEGTLPAEPFYRAPAYSFLLSIPLRWGLAASSLPDLARLLNAGGYLVSIGGILFLTWRTWRSRAAMWMGGLLFTLHPVPVFFAGDPYDAILSMACLVLALCGVERWQAAGWRGWGWPLGTAALLAVGNQLRSQLIPLVLLWPILAAGLALKPDWRQAVRPWRRAAAIFGLAVLPHALCLTAVGLANWRVAGDFRTAPWHGPFALYLTNHPGIFRSFIYKQTVMVDPQQTGRFPSQEESMILFQLAHRHPPRSIDELNGYFMTELRKAIQADFGGWLKLPLRRLYALGHDHESYDNKTWAMQKELAPVLRHNPVSWLWLLLPAVAGGWVLARRRPGYVWCAAGLVAAYSTVILLTIANNRYRLPLYVPLAVLAGGVAGLPDWWREAGRRSRGALIGILLTLLVLLGHDWFGLTEEDTRPADCMLMAQAALQAGQDREAGDWAQAARAWWPKHAEAMEIQVMARYNEGLAGGTWPEGRELAIERRRIEYLLRQLPPRRLDPLRFLQGLYAWQAGDRLAAWQTWVNLTNGTSRAAEEALAALIATSRDPTPWLEAARTLPTSRLQQPGLLATALADPRHPTLRRLFGEGRNF